MTIFSSGLHPAEETPDERGPTAEHRPGAAGRASPLPARPASGHRGGNRPRCHPAAAPAAATVPDRRGERPWLPAGLPAGGGPLARPASTRAVAVRQPAHARRALSGLGVLPDRRVERT